MDLSYTIYDTAPFDDTGGETFTLFRVAQGGDTTHTKSFTNARGAGQFPAEESFLVNKICVWVDDDATAADMAALWENSYLEFRVRDETMLLSPLSEFAANGAYGGHYSEASASDEAIIGKAGNGRVLEIPVNIPGGTTFRVDVYQGAAMSADPINVKVALYGTLTR